MTRKDFETVARILHAMKPIPHNPYAELLWCKTVESFAATFTASNPRFDRARFLAACGMMP